jgi:diguanylate cyclase (GGDEF)-like protein
LMAERCISCLVVSENERPVGIISERDIVKLLANSIVTASRVRVKDLMSSPVDCISQNTDLSEAGRLMKSKSCRRFPVVDSNGVVVGLVTQSDVMSGSLHVLEEYSHGLEQMVEARTKELRKKNRELEILSTTDPLTGLHNRRFLYSRIEEELSRSRRLNANLGCVMLDIDHFKPVNDNHGHSVGDIVLREVGQILRKAVRKEDVVARYGGEEFVVIGASDAESMMMVAERIRNAVASHPFVSGETTISLTISCGVSICYPATAPYDADDVLRGADLALYTAKMNGRNRTEVYEEPIVVSV